MSAGTVTETEAQYQATVLELATRMGWQSMHVRKAMGSRQSGNWLTPTSVAGWPDAVLWSQRQKRILFVEFKTDTGRVSPAQRILLASLIASGQEVYVWRPRNFDEVRRLLDHAPTEQNP